MIIEQISKDKFIVDFVDSEYNELRLLALALYNGNLSTLIEMLLTDGISVYKEHLETGHLETET